MASPATDITLDTLLQLAQLIGTSADNVTTKLTLILSGLVAIGVLSMATIDLIKLFPVRRYFFNYFIRRYIYRALATITATGKSVADLSASSTETEEYIAKISTGGDVNLFYSLDLESLISTIKTVANIALSWPQSQEHLLFIKIWSNNKDVVWEEFDSLLRQERQLILKEQKAADKLNAYVASLIDSNLNGLKLQIKNYWKLTQQVASVLISMAIIILFIDQSTGWLCFAFVGGLLAPLSHDIVASLTKTGVSR